MKKRLLGLCFLTTTLLFAGCANESTTTEEATQETTEEASQDIINVVATSFHEYDWLLQVIGDNIDNYNLTLLLDDGVDLHNYEPTVDDIATITTSDLFIYNGGESDAWVSDVLATSEDLNTVNVIEVLDNNVMAEVLVEGMEEDEDHDHDHDDESEETEESEDHDHDEETEGSEDHDHDDESEETEDHDHDDETEESEDHDHDDESEETDEHVWLSLENAAIVCAHFADVLSELDAENADTYEANADEYIAQLNELDEAYETMVLEAARDTIIVTDRFPFLYLVSDYGINYYAAFSGCSAETEASFATIIFLAEKADEYDVNYLLTIENGLVDLATTVAENSSDANREILELNSMQSIASADIEAGATYYSIMEENLEVLRLALSE
ncbi:MAG: metal ABC transporter substrate-binding protein [Eubacteriales bacterium]